MPDIVEAKDHRVYVTASSPGRMARSREIIERLELDPVGAQEIAEAVLKFGPPTAIYVHETVVDSKRKVTLSFAFKKPESPDEHSG